jgi:hypothetical protein
MMIHVCNVEEVHATNFEGFLYWHFVCPACKVRCRMRAGEGEVNCARCKVSYLVKSSGSVFREQPVSIKTYRPTPSEDGPPKRGLGTVLSGLATAASEANEAAHGRRLREGLLSTGAQLKGMEEHLLNRTMQAFISKCDALTSELDNWSKQGRVKIGRELQARARREFDFNQVESYALWLAGAWLESGSRTSADALFVRRALEELRGRV